VFNVLLPRVYYPAWQGNLFERRCLAIADQLQGGGGGGGRRPRPPPMDVDFDQVGILPDKIRATLAHGIAAHCICSCSLCRTCKYFHFEK